MKRKSNAEVKFNTQIRKGDHFKWALTDEEIQELQTQVLDIINEKMKADYMTDKSVLNIK